MGVVQVPGEVVTRDVPPASGCGGAFVGEVTHRISRRPSPRPPSACAQGWQAAPKRTSEKSGSNLAKPQPR